ncbi:hypothetical protein Tco_0988764 [Tanacetum coccineum]|uniref:Uncharacterized protein n=1 Tax=Tanacetum coccineum TaxID=301880 RepID=A0ABQ5ERV7_9ASTR
MIEQFPPKSTSGKLPLDSQSRYCKVLMQTRFSSSQTLGQSTTQSPSVPRERIRVDILWKSLDNVQLRTVRSFLRHDPCVPGGSAGSLQVPADSELDHLDHKAFHYLKVLLLAYSVILELAETMIRSPNRYASACKLDSSIPFRPSQAARDNLASSSIRRAVIVERETEEDGDDMERDVMVVG